MLGFGSIGQWAISFFGDQSVLPPVSTVTGISVTPPAATQASGTIQFNVVVSGTNGPSQATTRSISGPGSIDTSDLYSLPAQTDVVQYATITWVSVQDDDYSVSAMVTIPAAGDAPLTGTVRFIRLRRR